MAVTSSVWTRLWRWLLGDHREAVVQAEPPATPPTDPREERIGVCCSGGGIRSASFNLGALQALQAGGRLQEARYLAAVSGGAYIADAWSVMHRRVELARGKVAGCAEAPDPFAPGSPEERYLRDHTRYIAPDAATTANLVWRLLFGMAVNVLVLGLLLEVTARPLGWLYGWRLAPGLLHGGVHPTLPGWTVWLVSARCWPEVGWPAWSCCSARSG